MPRLSVHKTERLVRPHPDFGGTLEKCFAGYGRIEKPIGLNRAVEVHIIVGFLTSTNPM